MLEQNDELHDEWQQTICRQILARNFPYKSERKDFLEKSFWAQRST